VAERPAGGLPSEVFAFEPLSSGITVSISMCALSLASAFLTLFTASNLKMFFLSLVLFEFPL